MGVRRAQCLPRTSRLHSPADFRRVFARGLRVETRFFQLLGTPSATGQTRLGLATSRRLGPATARNRAKRLLRESFRRSPLPEGLAVDLVLVPKKALLESAQAEVDHEYRQCLGRFITRINARSRRARPPSDD